MTLERTSSITSSTTKWDDFDPTKRAESKHKNKQKQLVQTRLCYAENTISYPLFGSRNTERYLWMGAVSHSAYGLMWYGTHP